VSVILSPTTKFEILTLVEGIMSVMMLKSYRLKYNELVSLSWEFFGMTAINDLVMWVNRLRMILYINAILLMVH
jgi:hypothetical protein